MAGFEKCGRLQDMQHDKTSRVKIISLNEKKCYKTWKDEICDFTNLHPYPKVADWNTAHYMTNILSVSYPARC
jgi:hypothetical protein